MSSSTKSSSSPYAVVPALASFWEASAPAIEPHSKRRGPHDFQPWGDDEKYERCAGCGTVREISTKQGRLF